MYLWWSSDWKFLHLSWKKSSQKNWNRMNWKETQKRKLHSPELKCFGSIESSFLLWYPTVEWMHPQKMSLIVSFPTELQIQRKSINKETTEKAIFFLQENWRREWRCKEYDDWPVVKRNEPRNGSFMSIDTIKNTFTSWTDVIHSKSTSKTCSNVILNVITITKKTKIMRE